QGFSTFNLFEPYQSMISRYLNHLEFEVIHLLKLCEISRNISCLHEIDRLALHRHIFSFQFFHGIWF
ncbi:MAG: hypothetical protein ACI87M_000117, partial [Yoonia sp.]